MITHEEGTGFLGRDHAEVFSAVAGEGRVVVGAVGRVRVGVDEAGGDDVPGQLLLQPACWTRPSNRSTAPSNGPAPPCYAACRRPLTLTGDRICAMTRFEAGVLSWFGLP
jgi:hypothetical protein